ncbi:MAG: glycosyltransferase family 2 protein, partial [Flavobacteriaceae bacterium]|nr:glycosyltransferase family 2 protein [Flavobacteriaceae bacterium]
MNKPKVTIITPIYNAEKYIEKCAVSLFEQDFENIEYIFVNDCSPDNSVEILEKVIEKYPNRKPNVKIIHHEENKGSGATRKTGIKNATGEYTIQIDSDDWCELDMISELYKKAKETDADIVVCDYFENTKGKETYIKQNYEGLSPQEVVREFFNGNIHSSLCNKLVKRSLYTENMIYPPTEISWLEDMWLNTRLFTVAETLAYVPKAFLHYRRDNSYSTLHTLTSKHIEDFKFFATTTKSFLQEHKVYHTYKTVFLCKVLETTMSLGRFPPFSANEFIKDIMP